MDLNTFTIDQLPFQTSEALPKDCTKYDVMMGAVPDEKDNTNPVYYMDEIFAASGEQPTPVGPKDNEIWYTGEYYDMQQVIEIISQQGLTYHGPKITSNEKVGDKYVITFDCPVTKLGALEVGEVLELYPIFAGIAPEVGIECNITGIEIPRSITCIGDGAFERCESLSSITILDSVTSIGQGVFYECTSLTSVTIPNSVTSIGDDAFYGCTSLAEVIYTGTINEWEQFGFTEETTPFNYMSPVEYVTCSDGQTELVKNGHH